MKKAGLLIAALCAAGVASASSVNWSAATGLMADGNFHTGTGITTTATFSLAVVFSVSDVATFAASTSGLIAVTNAGGGSTGPSFIVKQNGTVGGKAHAVTNVSGLSSVTTGSSAGTYYDSLGSVTIADILTVGTNSAVITVNMFQNATNQRCATYALWLNGQELTEATHTNIGAGVYDYQSLAVVDGGTAYYMNGMASAEDIASLVPVPEPTVLGLLALGVAGLALRRKAA